MCGIFGYIGKNTNAKDVVLSGIKSLEYRGYDSWGIAVLDKKGDKNKIVVKKKAGKIGNATTADLPFSSVAFGHTRWATHGGVTDENAHPHVDCHGQFAIIHNGIIENYDTLKKELLSSGHRFKSDTDTEVAVHLIEEIYNSKLRTNLPVGKAGNSELRTPQEIFIESVRQAFNKFVGLSAIIVMDAHTSSFVAVKNGSPLVVGKGKDENFFASDAHAILPYTKKVYFVNDDELIFVSKDEIHIYSASDGKEKNVKFTQLLWDLGTTSKGKYPHFMIKEIHDQVEVIANITDDSTAQINEFAKLIKHSYGTYFVGCGTAAYACLAGTYIFSKVARRHVNFTVGSEFGYSLDFLTPKSLVVAFSQSGETIDVIEAVRKAKLKGAKIGTMVNVLGSTLYRIADYKLLLGAGIEKAVVSTKAFTAKLAYLILTAYTLINDRDSGNKIMRQSQEALREVLRESSLKKIKQLIEFLADKEHIYIIGRGLSYPIALETALKIKEASYIHAEGFAAGELKHGAIALVEKDTPCIAFLPNDETYGANLAGAMEMKARGGYIIGISYKPHEIFDYYLPYKDCGIASAIPSVVIGQLIGYFLAVKKNIDPDKPRNLAKSVTVK
jgi:glucosamine--fructose-6-phosphate aminotransferase (isomerizing)